MVGRAERQASRAACGDLVIEKLDASIEFFNATLDRVEEASNEASNPTVKSVLDRIYSNLEATKEQLVNAILKNKE